MDRAANATEAADLRLPPPGANDPLIATGAREILTAVGEVVYEWSIPDDSMRWGANVLDVITVASMEAIATGRGFAALLDSGNLTSRHDAVLNSTNTDHGGGVPYQVQYSLNPGGNGTEKRLWIEDIGRWYAGEGARPVRAHGVLRVINERYEREQRLAFLSRYDDLTGYFNRAHLLATLGDAITHAKRFRSSIAFIIVAVDNFRAINEAYGFDIADQIFAAVARRIKSQLREGDAIGRYTGNKLGLVLMDCDEANMAVAAERFHAVVREAVITTEAGSVAVTASIGGVAMPRHGRTTNEAMAHAQEALHSARLRGHGHFIAYSHSPLRQERRRGNAALSGELVGALNEGRLRLAFQPVADIRTRETRFEEGLLRLERSDGVLVPASEFIVLSERLGLIRLIDHRVLDLGLERLAASDRTISLNLSGETVGDSEWLAHLSGAIARNPELGRRLIFEITESAVIRNVEEASRFVALLHDLGCRVAIDDFGAGFSSFRNLRGLDVDLVKIDGAFVEHLPASQDDQVFVRTLIDLARNFGIETVAEWVPDERAATMLAGWGADMIQGSLIGPPDLDRQPPRPVSAAPRSGPMPLAG